MILDKIIQCASELEIKKYISKIDKESLQPIKPDLSDFKIEPFFDFNNSMFPSLNLNSRSKLTEVQSSIQSFIEHSNFLYWRTPINTYEFEFHTNVMEKLCVFASKGSWDDIKRIEELLKYDLKAFEARYPPGILLHLAIHNGRSYSIIKLLLNYSEKFFAKDEHSKASYQLILKSKPVQNLFHHDPEFYSRFIQNLFHYDPELCKEVRRQKLNYNIHKLSKVQDIESQIGPVATYATLQNIDGPVSTLKELSVMKVSKLCSAARTT